MKDWTPKEIKGLRKQYKLSWAKVDNLVGVS